MLLVVFGHSLRGVFVFEEGMQTGALLGVVMQQSSQEVLGGLGQLGHSIRFDPYSLEGKGFILKLDDHILIGQSMRAYQHVQQYASQVPHHHRIVLLILILPPLHELGRLMFGTP